MNRLGLLPCKLTPNPFRRSQIPAVHMIETRAVADFVGGICNMTVDQKIVAIGSASGVLFWIGYRIHPLYRAFGMGATAYLNVGLLAFAIWKGTALGV